MMRAHREGRLMRLRATPFVLATLLVASSLALVTAQYRARGLFVDLENAQRDARQLEADGNRLRIELGRAGQPSVVEASARRLGMAPATVPRTVLLPGDALVHPAEIAGRAPAAVETAALAATPVGRH